jgi:hypothetical protein
MSAPILWTPTHHFDGVSGVGESQVAALRAMDGDYEH